MLARTVFKTLLVAATATHLMFSAAEAAPITYASFGLGGAFDPAVGTHLGTTTGIFIGNGGVISVSSAGLGDLAGILTVGTPGTMADIPSFSTFVPINNFFTIAGGVAFDLNTFVVHSQSGPVPGFINASGSGVLSAPGFDDTVATISLSGTSVNNASFTIGVTATAITPPNPVPEPFSAALLGLGLLAAGATHRLKARATTV